MRSNRNVYWPVRVVARYKVDDEASHEKALARVAEFSSMGLLTLLLANRNSYGWVLGLANEEG